MSGIDLLFNTAIDYERTHQLALYTLLKQSKLGKILQRENTLNILWEPEDQLFDLAIESNNKKTYIELKMWSTLSDRQKKRQTTFLLKNNAKGIYVLLGTSWFEVTSNDLESFSHGLASKVGYLELIDLLNKVITSRSETPDVLELALSYRIALEKQYSELANAYKGNKENKLFWYSLYDRIRNKLKTTSASIYTANNPGGKVYILNDNNSWFKGKCNNINIQLYSEVVNGTLCIKFYAETDDKNKKFSIRDRIRKSIHKELDAKYKVIDAGRIGRYMTACQIEHDFSNKYGIQKSAKIFDDIHSKMKNIINRI